MNKIIGALFKDNVMAAVNTMFKPKEKEKKKKKGGKQKYITIKRD